MEENRDRRRGGDRSLRPGLRGQGIDHPRPPRPRALRSRRGSSGGTSVSTATARRTKRGADPTTTSRWTWRRHHGARRLQQRRLLAGRRHRAVLQSGREVLRRTEGPGGAPGRIRDRVHLRVRTAPAVPRSLSRRAPPVSDDRVGHGPQGVVLALSRPESTPRATGSTGRETPRTGTGCAPSAIRRTSSRTTTPRRRPSPRPGPRST